MPDKSKLEYFRNLLKSCFVPELKTDLDSIPIQSEHFEGYRQLLHQQLPFLYDFVQQQKQLIFDTNEREAHELQACLIVLLCEISASSGTIYKISNQEFLKNANRLLRQNTQLNETVDDIIFVHYRDKLQKECWKRQLGAVHGFMRFLEYRYNEVTRNKCKMSMKLLNFCLSIGLNVRECHEPTYKQIGTRIFQIMLNYAQTDDILSMNIHSVIYDAVFKDVHYMDSVVATADIWNCLYKCLDFYKDIDSFSWSYVDDMLETLMRIIPLAPNTLISICLFKFVTKLCIYFTFNRHDIERKYNADLSKTQALDECRDICMDNSSHTIFRWAKNILNMFIVESQKLMQSVNVCRQLLLEMHRCYMACILPIPLKVIEPHILIFFDKFMAILMEVIIAQKRNAEIVLLIKPIVETFHQQLKRSPACEESSNLVKYREAFAKLLCDDINKSVFYCNIKYKVD